jgi:hypothetical protein
VSGARDTKLHVKRSAFDRRRSPQQDHPTEEAEGRSCGFERDLTPTGNIQGWFR